MSQEKSDAEYVANYRPNTMYKHPWKKVGGAYVSVVFEEDEETPEGVEIHTHPNARNRVKVKLSWVRESDEIKAIEIKKFKHYKNDGWLPAGDTFFGEAESVTISPTTLGLILDFLRTVSELDIGEINQRRMSLSVDGDIPLDEQMKRQLRTFLSRPGGQDFIAELIHTGFLQSGDIVNAEYRRIELQRFEDMMNDSAALREYAEEKGVSADREEGIWQEFFKNNHWIFGYGLDYRFQGILQSQPTMSEGEAGGSDCVESDFLLGDRRFISFVEIKKPSTPLFGSARNRARTWKLSTDLFDAVSQILEQKASGESFYRHSGRHDEDGNRITQKPHDAKVSLIIGSWAEIADDNDATKEAKQRTLELFRRGNPSVEIITYDELLDRAKFIVEKSAQTSESSQD